MCPAAVTGLGVQLLDGRGAPAAAVVAGELSVTWQDGWQDVTWDAPAAAASAAGAVIRLPPIQVGCGGVCSCYINYGMVLLLEAFSTALRQPLSCRYIAALSDHQVVTNRGWQVSWPASLASLLTFHCFMFAHSHHCLLTFHCFLFAHSHHRPLMWLVACAMS